MTIKQRMYPDSDAVSILLMHSSHARYVYNLANEQKLILQERGKYTNYNKQAAELTEAREEYDWLREGVAQIQQAALRDNDQAWQNRFKNSKHFGAPGWRKMGLHEGFTIPQPKTRKINGKWAEIWIPKHDWVKFRLTRPYREIEAAKTAKIKGKPNGEWDVSFVSVPQEFKRERTGAIVGIDMGVEHTLALSNGEFKEAPTALSEGEQRRFNALSRLLPTQWGPANKKFREAREKDKSIKPSNRYNDTKCKLAELHDRAKRRRTDWIEKTTTELVRDYDGIGIENLKISNMTKKATPKPDPENEGQYLPNGAAAKRGLNKSILSQGWGQIRTRLEQKAEYSTPTDAAVVVAVNPKDTSLQCRECHYISKENRKSQAIFLCVLCGHTANADTHASLNIEDRARAILDGVEVQSQMLQRLLAALSVDPPVDLKERYAEGQAVNGQSGSDPAMPSLDEDKELTIVPNPQPESPSFR